MNEQIHRGGGEEGGGGGGGRPEETSFFNSSRAESGLALPAHLPPGCWLERRLVGFLGVRNE